MGVVAALLAIPVIAFVIAESLVRRTGARRPALLVAGLLLTTGAATHLSAATRDQPPAAVSATLAGEDQSLAVPVATERPAVAALERPANQFAIGADETRHDVRPVPEAPAVVRFRPRHGWTEVSRFTAASVRFTQPMDRNSTARAFRVSLGDKQLEGTLRWAETDTVLVLVPARPLPYGARVTLSVDAGARSADGMQLIEQQSITFTVLSRPAPKTRAATAAPTPRPTARPTPKPPASATTGWRWPLLGPITQLFGESLTKYGFHQGIDIDGDTGDPVRAARTGRVVVAGYWDECGGLQVHIDHGSGLSSWYRHLSRIDVSKGSQVEVGAVIGRVGNTGCSLGSHLHFGIRLGTTFVDPLRYLPPR
jgi:murein DD-endopeptidase MepM/ murein hydrolase activator NlpD